MAIKIVRADPKIVRREGLGAEQCAACGQVYRINHVPEVCVNDGCPTNQHDDSLCPPDGNRDVVDVTEELFRDLPGDRYDWRRRTKYGPRGSDY